MTIRRARRVASILALTTLLAPVAQPSLVATTKVVPVSGEVYRRPVSGVFQFQGHGWGHGHGMSQWGAQGAASLGKTWDEIIHFYYPTTTIAAVPAAQDTIRVWISGDDETDLRVLPATDLHVTDSATGATAVLASEAGVDMWRVTQTPTAQQVQKRLNGVWQTVPVNGVTDFAGPLEFSRPSVSWLTLALPGDKPANYRGVLRAARTSPSTMDTVDVLGMDTYLRGVVPHETPASFLPEALKAQAVAARTYAAFKRANAPSLTSGKFYDICDSTNCQVYGGMTGEAAASTAAVDATAGQEVLSNGKPAFTEFSSSNGGFSTDGGQPYLIAQPDPWDGAFPNSEHTWTGQITAAQLESAFPSVGHLTAITVTSRDGNGEWGGRVVDVQLSGVDVAGTATTVPTTGRGIFNARAWPTFRSPDGLRSSWWRITNSDAQFVGADPAPALVATSGPDAHQTITARLKILGTESFAASALSLLPVGSAPVFAPAPGRFVSNVTHPGALVVAPGDTFVMAVDVDTSATAPGAYVATFRLSDGTSTFGDPVTWNLTVGAPVVAGAVIGVAAPGAPPTVSGRTVVVPVAGSRIVMITVRNTGNVSWPMDGSFILATTPAGRVSSSAGPSWAAPDSPGALAAGARAFVAPGESADVAVELFGNAAAPGTGAAPGSGAAPGTAAESFAVVHTGVGIVTGATVTLTLRRTDPLAGLGRLPAGLSAYYDIRNHLNVLASGVDGQVDVRTNGSGGWGPAAARGGPVLGRPTAVRAAGGVVLTAARGLDGTVWWRTSASALWHPGHQAIRDEPALAATADGRVLVVARGPDGTVRLSWWAPAAGLGPWSRLGVARFASGLAATGGPAGVVIGAVGPTGVLSVDRWVGGRWSGWATLGHGLSDTAPTLTADPRSGTVRLFAVTSTGGLVGWTRGLASGWGVTATDLGAQVTAGPAAVSGAGNVHVLARFADGRVHIRAFGGGRWSSWVLAF